jgi:alpha-L-rhamnosidase
MTLPQTGIAAVETRHMRALRRVVVLVALLGPLWPVLAFAQSTPNEDSLYDRFLNPPDDCRIMMRWWWFGPAVDKPELQSELEQMSAAGIGGVEIANLYPLALDDPNTGFHNQPYLSDEHLDALRFAAAKARQLGMRVDITLGSGWPLGGPHIPVTHAAGLLRVETAIIPEHASTVALPDISAGEKLLAAFLVPGGKADLALNRANMLKEIHEGRVYLPTDMTGEHTAVFFISSRTGMVVKRPSVGAAGFVLDHYDRAATEAHLHAVGDRLMQAFGDHPPYAVFSDSLEDYGSNWTADFLEEFHRRRGYELTPYLPSLIGDIGPVTSAIRHDWGKTLTELANERFLIPMHSWAQQNHTLLRSQTYGIPPVTLSSNQYEDLPEGEGKADRLMLRKFSDVRWATSAGHLFGSKVISSETWTWLHSPAFRATPLDMKAEADLQFLQGVNQLVGHGWPYSPESAGEPGWRMYAAGAFNNHNPWSFVLPDLTRYLQRVSFALRQGTPANDVALFLPNDDAWATFKSGLPSSQGEGPSIDDSMDRLLGRMVIPQILDAGFNLDFIDADAIDKLGVPYPVLILPGVDRIPVVTYRKIEEYARHGGIVIATRRLPATSPGLMDAVKGGEQIKAISNELFWGQGSPGHWVENESRLERLLPTLIKHDVEFSGNVSQMGFIHRKLPAGDLYFVVNTDNRSHHIQASFRSVHKSAELWDAITGQITPVIDPSHVDLDLQPYESRLVYFSDREGKPATQKPVVGTPPQSVHMELTGAWELTFEGLNQTTRLDHLHSWSDTEAFKYYSGRVTYKTTFNMEGRYLEPGTRLYLNFGEGTSVGLPSPSAEHTMRAYLESPVREAAEVFVNGIRAGYVWHPPYSVRIESLLKAGNNELRIVVGNTAMNALSSRALPNYRLLKDRYGDLFTPQDMDQVSPIPSGILGKVQIVATPTQ